MYDGTTNDARLNRSILARELRDNPPADWDYRRIDQCALGVAHRLGLLPDVEGDPEKWDGLALLHNLGLSPLEGQFIFFHPFADPSPALVAQRLEEAPYV